MKIIQFILMSGLLISMVSYFRWFRNAVIDKIVIVVIFLIACFFIVNPDSTTRLATKIGVGRGTDLLLYLSIITFSYIVLVLYSKLRKQEKQLTELARKQALLQTYL